LRITLNDGQEEGVGILANAGSFVGTYFSIDDCSTDLAFSQVAIKLANGSIKNLNYDITSLRIWRPQPSIRSVLDAAFAEFRKYTR
jgi:hypothetical protein